MILSRTMGIASSAIALPRLPSVKSCCEPLIASRTAAAKRADLDETFNGKADIRMHLKMTRTDGGLAVSVAKLLEKPCFRPSECVPRLLNDCGGRVAV